MMGPRIAIAIAVLACSLLAGCSSPPSASQATASPAPLPPGVATSVSGIYRDSPCCWLGPDAEFRVLVPANASHVLLTVYMPADIPKLRNSTQQVTVVLDGRKTTFSSVPIGSKVLVIPIPRMTSNRTVDVKMHMSTKFVPKEELGSADTRALSIYLKTVRSL